MSTWTVMNIYLHYVHENAIPHLSDQWPFEPLTRNHEISASAISCRCIKCYLVQVNLMCTTTRTKIVIVGLAFVAVPIGCMSAYYDQLRRYYMIFVILEVLYFVFGVVVPATVLVINVMLVREVRRAANNAAANLGVQQHHQSTSSNSAVPTVMLITTSLVYVLLRGTASISWYLFLLTSSDFVYNCHVILASVSRLVYAYNFFVYLITGKQFRAELRTFFCRSSSSSSAATVVVYDRNDARLAAHGQADTAV